MHQLLKMTKKIILILLLVNSLITFAQEAPSYKFYGFVRSVYTLDSRKISSNAQELFSLYPMYRDLNASGEDLNATPSTSFTSVTTRFGFNFSIPTHFMGATKANAKIETDFTGAPNFMILRLRQAYTQMQWEHSSLLVGQTWHPMFTFGTQPLVLSQNSGALFQPFNRSPQVRYDYLLKNIKLTAAAIYQMQYTSAGPDLITPTAITTTYAYQRNALFPEWYVSMEAKSEHIMVGLGGEYKTIMPNRHFTDGFGVIRLNTNVLKTPALMLYGTWTSGKLIVSAKGVMGQNLSDLNLIGGYAITPDNKYIAYNSLSSFVHINYGVVHKVGLLGAFTKNLGPSKDVPAGSNFYGFGIDNANTVSERMISNIYRITPTYSYNYENWKLGVEFEYTNAAWGNRSATGSIIHPERISNTRIFAILAYTF